MEDCKLNKSMKTAAHIGFNLFERLTCFSTKQKTTFFCLSQLNNSLLSHKLRCLTIITIIIGVLILEVNFSPISLGGGKKDKINLQSIYDISNKDIWVQISLRLSKVYVRHWSNLTFAGLMPFLSFVFFILQGKTIWEEMQIFVSNLPLWTSDQKEFLEGRQREKIHPTWHNRTPHKMKPYLREKNADRKMTCSTYLVCFQSKAYFNSCPFY